MSNLKEHKATRETMNEKKDTEEHLTSESGHQRTLRNSRICTSQNIDDQISDKGRGVFTLDSPEYSM